MFRKALGNLFVIVSMVVLIPVTMLAIIWKRIDIIVGHLFAGLVYLIHLTEKLIKGEESDVKYMEVYEELWH